jgi:hypothetical protein
LHVDVGFGAVARVAALTTSSPIATDCPTEPQSTVLRS